jgi:hypothetical protein
MGTLRRPKKIVNANILEIFFIETQTLSQWKNLTRSKTNLAELGAIKDESRRTTPFDIAFAMQKHALAIPDKAIACLYLGGFSADNHARILPHNSQLR